MTGKERKGRVLGGRKVADTGDGKDKRCPVCGAGPGNSCQKWSPNRGWVSLKTQHWQRKA